MAIYVTGDLHGEVDIKKLNNKNFPIGKELTKDDYLILCGDFGLRFFDNKSEEYWLEWLEDKEYCVLFADGNHENYNLLESYPIEEWKGGKIRRIKEHVIHLTRGQVFDIDGKKIFVMGGAKSDDREHIEGQYWWAREMPSEEEYLEGLSNLEKHDWKVDYVITHCTNTTTLPLVNQYRLAIRFPDELTQYLEKIKRKLSYKRWFFGHYHCDVNFSHLNMRAIYRDIVEIDYSTEKYFQNEGSKE